MKQARKALTHHGRRGIMTRGLIERAIALQSPIVDDGVAHFGPLAGTDAVLALGLDVGIEDLHAFDCFALMVSLEG